MAKAVLICRRFTTDNDSSQKDLQKLSSRLIPGNINPHSPLFIKADGLSIAVYNPTSATVIKESSFCLGQLIDNSSDWHKPGGPIPDGSYALFRSDPSTVEVLTDFLATRTIWFIHQENIFIASTSQRAIISLLRDYMPNKQSFTWILSSGNLGPGLSWDTRIQCLQGNSLLKLDRNKWTVGIEHPRLIFQFKLNNNQNHENQLYECIQNTLKGFNLNFDKWILPLSGGYDSRTLLCMLQDKKNIRCVTWGKQSSLHDPHSDASIALKLASHFNAHHEFHPTDVTIKNFDVFLDQFLIAGEGRVDHISGYMDGFLMWKKFFESNYEGIIRGDQGFGWLDIKYENIMRHSLECIFLNEYQSLKPQDFNLPEQKLPDFLKRQPQESLLDWRDRFFLEFRVPYVKAALNDLKSAYVEIISPFLTRSVIKQVLGIPANLRTNKSLFRKIALNLSPDIDFAHNPSILSFDEILNAPKISTFFNDELNSCSIRSLLSPKLLDLIIQAFSVNQQSVYQSNKIKSILVSLKRILNPRFFKKTIDFKRLALRVCIIHRMNKLLQEDAHFLNN